MGHTDTSSLTQPRQCFISKLTEEINNQSPKFTAICEAGVIPLHVREEEINRPKNQLQPLFIDINTRINWRIELVSLYVVSISRSKIGYNDGSRNSTGDGQQIKGMQRG